MPIDERVKPGRFAGKELSILMRVKQKLVVLSLGAALVGAPAFAVRQDATTNQSGGVKQDAKKAGEKTKDAAKTTGHDVKKGTTKAYHATKTDSKKAYHATAKGTKKVWHKTKDTTKGAAEGAKEGSKQ